MYIKRRKIYKTNEINAIYIYIYIYIYMNTWICVEI